MYPWYTLVTPLILVRYIIINNYLLKRVIPGYTASVLTGPQKNPSLLTQTRNPKKLLWRFFLWTERSRAKRVCVDVSRMGACVSYASLAMRWLCQPIAQPRAASR